MEGKKLKLRVSTGKVARTLNPYVKSYTDNFRIHLISGDSPRPTLIRGKRDTTEVRKGRQERKGIDRVPFKHMMPSVAIWVQR